ncbi:M20 family metallo-hydrolase [Peribacillus castrilensis]|uniref:N-carbamoyl-L-amino acid amidohydrolase n=1 Tax=Peribacillus simplex TaxID=1478 RepID=A0AAN2TTN1_9BACI|nr:MULTISPECIES: M20 family metallo-hydrolase [Bacillaceae]MCF7622001.1 M20 family metallo-hydrolase [Peribacillus frigoritolerans]MCT1390702.1 M20 family metallo-hydrolase [Peribacillus frigoritolerans]PRA86363.1 Zn-dependent hydrolase [Peribacillus simplex]CEG33233.1 N-carbamoyl-L-amino acid amidohydrolase [Peribacillus simplex]
MKTEKFPNRSIRPNIREDFYKINKERLLSTINTSANYGALPNGGLCRLALSEDDRKIRDIFMEWMKECRLDIRIDDVGNMYGRRPGKNPDAHPVVLGSHLDTQPIGGRYDGILGVMGALEVVRTLNDYGIETERPIEIVNFTNEEGARFIPSMLGSGIVANAITQGEVLKIVDKDHLKFVDELKTIGYKGSSENRLKEMYCYFELHIEQGPILEANRQSIGAVTGIQGISTLEVVITGRTSHAGTTPMENRNDAMLSAAKMIQDVYKSYENFPGSLITIGQIQSLPNVTNSVAGQVVFSIDIRHPEDAIRMLITKELKERLSTTALINKMDLLIKDLMEVKAEKFSGKIVREIQLAANKLGYSSMKLISGAGHDAKFMNQMAPTGMIFIPSIGGVSHCEEEFSTDDDIEKGVQVLLELVLRFANRKDRLQR